MSSAATLTPDPVTTLVAPSPASRFWPARHFHGIGYVVLILTLASNIPTALYGLYRSELGFNALTQTAIFATYAITLVPSLWVFGPLSDRIGRRPVLVVALTTGILAVILLATAHSTLFLFVGRALQGISIGACSAAGAAGLLEHVPGKNATRAAKAATVTAAAGCALGPVFAGVIAEYLPMPLVLPYVLFLAILVPGVIALMTLPRTERASGTSTSHLIELPRIPSAVRTTFFVATSPVAVSWAVAGLYLSVVPSWIVELLGVSNLLIGAVAAALMMVCSSAAQMAMRGLDPLRAQQIGLLSTFAGVLGLVAVDLFPSLTLLFIVTVAVGVGHGLIFSGGMQRVGTAIAKHAPSSGGSVLAAFFTFAYAAVAVASIAAGVLINFQGMKTAMLEFSIATAVLTAAVLVINLRGKPAPATRPATLIDR